MAGTRSSSARRAPRRAPAPPPSRPAARRPRVAVRPRSDAAPRRTAVRWDRVGRLALLGTLLVIMLLYVSPLTQWVAQSSTAGAQRAELQRLQREQAALEARARALNAPGAIEREARKLGMVRDGERPFIVETPDTP